MGHSVKESDGRKRTDAGRASTALSKMSQGDRNEAGWRGGAFSVTGGSKTVESFAASPRGSRAIMGMAGQPGAYTTKPKGDIRVMHEGEDMGRAASGATRAIENKKKRKAAKKN